MNLSGHPASNSNEAVFSIINQVNITLKYYIMKDVHTGATEGRIQYRKDKATCLSHLEQPINVWIK